MGAHNSPFAVAEPRCGSAGGVRGGAPRDAAAASAGRLGGVAGRGAGPSAAGLDRPELQGVVAGASHIFAYLRLLSRVNKKLLVYACPCFSWVSSALVAKKQVVYDGL